MDVVPDGWRDHSVATLGMTSHTISQIQFGENCLALPDNHMMALPTTQAALSCWLLALALPVAGGDGSLVTRNVVKVVTLEGQFESQSPTPITLCHHTMSTLPTFSVHTGNVPILARRVATHLSLVGSCFKHAFDQQLSIAPCVMPSKIKCDG
jgi:hypothetical protein